MENQERLYALALSLVPDVDLAGDLFMDARSEADLLQRAARWRRQQGLPVLNPPACLPDLTPEEAEYANHLARRGRRRRQMRPLSAISALTVLAILVVMLGFRGTVLADRGLAADLIFRAEPLAVSEQGSLDFAVYRVDATPGSVTFWWALQGRNAAHEGAGLELDLVRNWLPNHATLVSEETAVSRDDRLVGRTTFQLPVPSPISAALTATRRGNSRPDWTVALLIRPQLDPGARTVAVDQSLLASDDAVKVTVLSVTVADDYTTVRYRLEGVDYRAAAGYQLDVVANGTAMERYGVLRPSTGEGDVREVLFAPVPSGASNLELRFPQLAEASQSDPAIAINLRP